MTATVTTKMTMLGITKKNHPKTTAIQQSNSTAA
jgi:hypothetical protein